MPWRSLWRAKGREMEASLTSSRNSYTSQQAASSSQVREALMLPAEIIIKREGKQRENRVLSLREELKEQKSKCLFFLLTCRFLSIPTVSVQDAECFWDISCEQLCLLFNKMKPDGTWPWKSQQRVSLSLSRYRQVALHKTFWAAECR